MIRNEKNELIPTRTVIGWKVCIDYRKLNTATKGKCLLDYVMLLPPFKNV